MNNKTFHKSFLLIQDYVGGYFADTRLRTQSESIRIQIRRQVSTALWDVLLTDMVLASTVATCRSAVFDKTINILHP